MSISRKKIFVSSPGDVDVERRRVERVTQKLNGEYFDTLEFFVVRWENQFYTADRSFQPQIDRSIECDIVVGILWARLGTPLPSELGADTSGRTWPSGTAYEIMTAIAQRHEGAALPDVYIFRKTADITLPNDRPSEEREILKQRDKLNAFWQEHFHTVDGEFKAAFQTFKSPDEFEEKLERLLRQWIEDNNLANRTLAWPTSLKGSPFRGLEPFDASHSAVFFGRDRDISRGIELLRRGSERGFPSLLLIGASGSGKSSLLRAGIVPRLVVPGVIGDVTQFRVARFRPMNMPSVVESLAHSLFEPGALPELASGAFGSPSALAAQLSHADQTSAAPILAALADLQNRHSAEEGRDKKSRVDLVLVVDQLEEIFVESADRQQLFGAILGALCETGRVWIATTLRADFYEQLLAVPSLAELKKRSASMDVAAPGYAELAEVIRGPASAAGLTYGIDPATGQSLDERILADVSPDMLPLLQFSLQRLYEERANGEDDVIELTHAVYDRLGGIDGAVDTEAESALKVLGAAELSALPQVLRKLAVIEVGTEGRSITSRPLHMNDIKDNPAAIAIVDRLVRARIFLSDRSDAEGATIRLAHEKIFSAWRRAASVLHDSREFLYRRRDAEEQHRRWLEGGKKKNLLIPSGLPLKQARTLLTYGDELEPDVRAYVKRSIARRRNRIITISSVCVFLFLYLGINIFAASMMFSEAEDKVDVNKVSQAFDESYADLRTKIDKYIDDQLATVVSIRPKAERYLDIFDNINYLSGGNQDLAIKKLADLSDRYSDKEDNIYGGVLAQLSTASLIAPMSAIAQESVKLVEGAVPRDVFYSNGQEIYRYKLNSDLSQSEVLKFDFDIGQLSASPDGRYLISYVADKLLNITGMKIIDPKSGKVIHDIQLFEENGDLGFYDPKWSPDSHYVALRGFGDSFLTLVDVASGEVVRPAAKDQIMRFWVRQNVFHWAQDSKSIISTDGFNGVWKTALDGSVQSVNCDLGRSVYSLALNADGRLLAASTELGVNICNLDAPDKAAISDRFGFGEVLTTMAWSPDGRSLVGGTINGQVILYSIAKTDEAYKVRNGWAKVVNVVWSPDDSKIATSGEDGAVHVWDSGTGKDLLMFNEGEAVLSLVWLGQNQLLTVSETHARLLNVGGKPKTIAFGNIEQARLASLAPEPVIVQRSDAERINRCDELAAHPFDPRKPPGTGVVFESIFARDAVPACMAATRERPDEPRFIYQLGRSLVRQDEKTEEAVEAYEKAAAAGYPMATYALGNLYRFGDGVEQDADKAMSLLNQAAGKGVLEAEYVLGWMAYRGEGREKPDAAEAQRIWRHCADMGHSHCHEQLAVLADGLFKRDAVDLPQALLHYALATRLYEEAGMPRSAVTTRLRRASLAKYLDPAVSANVLPAIRDWKPKSWSPLD